MTRLRKSLLKLPKIPSYVEWNKQFKTKSAMNLPRATLADPKAAGKSLMTTQRRSISSCLCSYDRTRPFQSQTTIQSIRNDSCWAVSRYKHPIDKSQHSFIHSWLSKGFGAWTVAMANAGFQRIIALENNAKYAKWMGVRNHSTSFQGSCSFSGFLEHCTRIKRRGGTSQEGWLWLGHLYGSQKTRVLGKPCQWRLVQR